jgi:hypothetical protein
MLHTIIITDNTRSLPRAACELSRSVGAEKAPSMIDVANGERRIRLKSRVPEVVPCLNIMSGWYRDLWGGNSGIFEPEFLTTAGCGMYFL